LAAPTSVKVMPLALKLISTLIASRSIATLYPVR